MAVGVSGGRPRGLSSSEAEVCLSCVLNPPSGVILSMPSTLLLPPAATATPSTSTSTPRPSFLSALEHLLLGGAAGPVVSTTSASSEDKQLLLLEDCCSCNPAGH